MNRRERRAAKLKAPKPTLREVVTSLCLAAPWCIRSRWGAKYAPSLEMSFAGREVLRRHQHAAEMVPSVLVIGNPRATLCIGDHRAGYELLVRRGDLGELPPFEEWRTKMLFGPGANGRHAIVRAHDEVTQAFADLTFSQVTVLTKGVIEAPPAFAAFGVEWPAATIGDVWFGYTTAPEIPEMEAMSSEEWIGLIDDLDTLVGIALDCRNNGAVFDAEMARQERQIGR